MIAPATARSSQTAISPHRTDHGHKVKRCRKATPPDLGCRVIAYRTTPAVRSLPLKRGGSGWGSSQTKSLAIVTVEYAIDPHPARKSAPTSPFQGEVSQTRLPCRKRGEVRAADLTSPGSP